MKKGKLIVIDGTDGSGKATQTELLVARLKKEGIKVKKIDFPQYTENFFGAVIRECLDGKYGNFLAVHPKIASVLYAADRFETSGKIKKWLAEGYMVISDRYVSANQIHQGGKIQNERARKEFLAWLDTMEFEVFQIPRPDAIIYLHVPLEVSLKLITNRAEEKSIKLDLPESNPKHLFDSQQSALKIIGKNNTWIKIFCAERGVLRSRQEIHEEIFQKIKKSIR
jgi:dTMP kinase